MPSGFISMSVLLRGCWSVVACSAVKGVEDRPWKERVQSGSDDSEGVGEGEGGGSERPAVRDRRGGGGIGSLGVCGGLRAVGGLVLLVVLVLEGAVEVVEVVDGGFCCRVGGLEAMRRRWVARQEGAVRKARRLPPALLDAAAFMVDCVW